MNDPMTLLVACLAGTFVLRSIGVIGAEKLERNSALFRWVGCVAFAIAAGLMAKIILVPKGILAETSLFARLLGVGVGGIVFFTFGRNPRDQESYEADVRRIEMIDPATIKV